MVSEAVVDLFETVQVCKDKNEALVGARCVFQFLFGQRQESSPVIEPCQIIRQ
jgi:hypothetical protein